HGRQHDRRDRFERPDPHHPIRLRAFDDSRRLPGRPSPNGQGVKVRRRLGRAPTSRAVGPSLPRRCHPAAAIIAALSVHIARLGTKTRIESSSPTSANRRRSSELAATPPPSTRPRAPTSAAARRALATSTSTTAAWNEAATSAAETSGFLRTWLMTDVFKPLKLKSRPSL